MPGRRRPTVGEVESDRQDYCGDEGAIPGMSPRRASAPRALEVNVEFALFVVFVVAMAYMEGRRHSEPADRK